MVPEPFSATGVPISCGTSLRLATKVLSAVVLLSGHLHGVPLFLVLIITSSHIRETAIFAQSTYRNIPSTSDRSYPRTVVLTTTASHRSLLPSSHTTTQLLQYPQPHLTTATTPYDSTTTAIHLPYHFGTPPTLPQSTPLTRNSFSDPQPSPPHCSPLNSGTSFPSSSSFLFSLPPSFIFLALFFINTIYFF